MDNFKKINIFSSFLLLSVLTTLIYGFFSDFGLRDDEGFYLYYLKHGINEPTFTFFHSIGNILGSIFSYNLIGFRFLNLILLLVSINISVFYALQFYFDTFSVKNKYFYLVIVLVSISTLGFFSFIPTFSYTSCATIACFFWSAFIFNASKQGREEDLRYYSLLILTFIFAIGSRIQLFIILSATLPFFLFFIKNFMNKKANISIIRTILVLFIFTAIFLFFHLHFIAEILPVGKIIYKTTHDSLLMFYLSNVIYLLTHQDFYIVYISIVLISIYAYFESKKYKRIHINFIILIILILILKDLYGFSKSYFDIAGTPSNYSNRALRYLFILFIFTPPIIGLFNFLKSRLGNARYVVDKKFLFIYIVCLVGALSSSIGNNSNFIFWSAFSLGLPSIPLFLCILYRQVDISTRFVVIAVILISVINVSIIYREQIYQFRRSPIKSKDFKVSSSDYLKNIRVDSYSADVINNFLKTLDNISFDYKTDRIFAYPELPGLLATSDALSFGDAHNQHQFSKKNFRELKSIETKICAFLKYEDKSKVRNIYILSGEDMSEAVANCLNAIIDTKSEVKSYDLGAILNIGMAFNDYVEYKTKITFIGPYKVNKD